MKKQGFETEHELLVFLSDVNWKLDYFYHDSHLTKDSALYGFLMSARVAVDLALHHIVEYHYEK